MRTMRGQRHSYALCVDTPLGLQVGVQKSQNVKIGRADGQARIRTRRGTADVRFGIERPNGSLPVPAKTRPCGGTAKLLASSQGANYGSDSPTRLGATSHRPNVTVRKRTQPNAPISTCISSSIYATSTTLARLTPCLWLRLQKMAFNLGISVGRAKRGHMATLLAHGMHVASMPP